MPRVVVVGMAGKQNMAQVAVFVYCFCKFLTPSRCVNTAS